MAAPWTWEFNGAAGGELEGARDGLGDEAREVAREGGFEGPVADPEVEFPSTGNGPCGGPGAGCCAVTGAWLGSATWGGNCNATDGGDDDANGWPRGGNAADPGIDAGCAVSAGIAYVGGGAGVNASGATTDDGPWFSDMAAICPACPQIG